MDGAQNVADIMPKIVMGLEDIYLCVRNTGTSNCF